MFDSNETFIVPILSGGEKRCEVRFPTDAEWCERSRKHKRIRHILGRGKSQMGADNEGKVDLQLFNKIRVDQDGLEFDEAEASAVLKAIGRCEVTGVEREGNQYRIEMECPSGAVIHCLNIPKQMAVKKYNDVAYISTLDRRHAETIQHLEPAGELWDSVHVSNEGYLNGHVPIIHKYVAVDELVTEIEKAIGDYHPNR